MKRDLNVRLNWRTDMVRLNKIKVDVSCNCENFKEKDPSWCDDCSNNLCEMFGMGGSVIGECPNFKDKKPPKDKASEDISYERYLELYIEDFQETIKDLEQELKSKDKQITLKDKRISAMSPRTLEQDEEIAELKEKLYEIERVIGRAF